jgi:hypothetical protein
MNLMALPLMLGTGVDYTLFIQLALRRHGGDLGAVRRSVGRALMLCGGTAVAGFGSLGFSSNPGMASLGKVCAVGIGANMLISVFLLPAWWRLLSPKSKVQDLKSGRREEVFPQPSTFTRQPICLLSRRSVAAGLAVVRILPVGLVKGLPMVLAGFYWRFQRRRCEVVVQNFLPVFAATGRRRKRPPARRIGNFAAKLVDLWRVESGEPCKTG